MENRSFLLGFTSLFLSKTSLFCGKIPSRLLAVATSLKARILLSLSYGCGLRAGDVGRYSRSYRAGGHGDRPQLADFVAEVDDCDGEAATWALGSVLLFCSFGERGTPEAQELVALPICIGHARHALEAFFEELSVLTSSDPANVSARKAVFERYDMEIVGPPLADHSRA